MIFKITDTGEVKEIDELLDEHDIEWFNYLLVKAGAYEEGGFSKKWIDPIKGEITEIDNILDDYGLRGVVYVLEQIGSGVYGGKTKTYESWKNYIDKHMRYKEDISTFIHELYIKHPFSQAYDIIKAFFITLAAHKDYEEEHGDITPDLLKCFRILHLNNNTIGG